MSLPEKMRFTPDGYAVPVAFDGFVGEVGPFSDAFVVSALQLVRECENLIARTSPPLDAHEGMSAFCSMLLEAARHSIRSGCAVVFTA